MNAPILLGRDEGRDYWVWGDRYTFKATGEETGGAYALCEMHVHPGSGTPPHIHHAEDEMFYVTEGEVTFWAGEDRFVASAGSFVAVPKGTVHHFSNESGGMARCLVFLVPAGFERFFLAVGTEVSESCPTAPPVTPEYIEKALAIAGDYHMEIVTE